jgi:acyl-CoA dehydrogenase
VHKVVVANAVLKDYRPHEGLWPTEFLPHKREEARKKLEPLLAENPDLKRYADGMAAYLAGNRH